MGGGDSIVSPAPPPVPKIPVDPLFAQEQTQAENDLTRQLRAETQGDMAALMALYGTKLAISGYSGGRSPLAGGVSLTTGGKM